MVGTKAISNCFSSHSVAPIFDGHRGGKFTISRGMQSCRTTSFLTQGRALLEYEFLGGKKSGFEQLFVCSHGLHMGTWYTIHYPKSILCSLENDVLQSIKTWGFINFQTNPQVLATRVGYAPHQWITQGITRTTWMIFPCDRCSWPDGPAKSMISHQLKTMGSTSHDFGWLLTPITIWFIGDIW
jgi:hypothetical protein